MTVYDPSLVDKITDMFRDGSSITKVAAIKLGIHRDTYYEWKEKYPDFKRAAEIGEQIAEAMNEDTLDDGINGKIKNFSAAACIFKMKSRHRKTYGEQKEININGNIKSLTEQLIDTDDHTK